MSELQLQERWGYDDADLGANRLGKLSEKQRQFLAREHKTQRSVFMGVGAFIALAFCCLPVPVIGVRMLPSFISNPQSFNLPGPMPTLAIAGPILGALALVAGTVIVLYFLRARRDADITVRKAEGIVRYLWETKRVHTPGSSVREYEDTRALILHAGPERRFEVDEQLQDIVREGEEWIIYYTSEPFKFLSAERI